MASVGLMPTKKYQTDDFQYVIASTLGIFYMLSFLYPVSRIIRGLVLEKEQRIKEGMKMMGLSEFAYNLSWLITTLIHMSLVSILIVLVTSTTVFEYSDKFLVFIYFMAFSLAVINMCFLMATFFSRSKVASLMGPMIFFASFFPYYAVSDPSYSPEVKAATCLLAPSCFALGANVFANYEGGLVGVQFSNSAVETANFSYSLCVGMMVVDAVLYGVLAWYLDKILPSEFGTQLPFYFPLLPSYWCGVKITHDGIDLETLRKQLITAENTDNAKIEPVSSDLLRQQEENRCIMIRNLRKVYETTAEDRVAVKGLNLDIYEGQCTVLLGHNGAGKSTTISMLTGLISPTSGDAIIEGKRVSTDMGFIRQSLGVCPQHDILFPELTVLQHLKMFATFKGVPDAEAEAAAEKMIREVGLKEKTNVRSSMLSGGQKRKLSVGIALIGDSKIVILDEPTSGMDPYSRRSTWNIIQRNKKGRVILMTTHFMDEADILGDRIAIMAEGQLRCVGSSLFLKKNYGVGYTFTVVKDNQGQGGGGHIRDLVTRYVPEAEPLSNVGAEQSYRLPFTATPVFVDLFTEMDEQKEKLGIAEYGISVTTLEEVFIRVGKNTDDVHDRASITEFVEEKKTSVYEKETTVSNNAPSNGTADHNPLHLKQDAVTKGEDAHKYDGVGSLETDRDSVVFFKHFRALFMKRFIYGKRDRRMFLCQIVLPVLLVVLGLGLLQLQPDFNQPTLKLSPNKYNPTLAKMKRNYVPFNTESGPLGELMMQRFNGDTDLGVYGVAVPINTEEDQFANCSKGADPLRNMSNYLVKNLKPKDEHGSSKYGSVTVAAQSTLTDLSYNILVNGSAVHGVGIYMNLVHESFFQVLTNTPSASIRVRNFPLPRTWQQENNSAAVDAFTAALFFMIAFCFIPASYASFIVKEREVKAKHQQIISGVSIYAYWCSTFVWDVISYLPTVALVLVIVVAFGVDNYTKNDGGVATFLLFLLYGPAVASFTYLMSFLFRSHSTAQLIVMFFNFLSGLCLMVVSFVLTTIHSTESVAVDLRYLFRLFPSFCLGDGLTQLALCDNGNDCPNIGRDGYNFDDMVGPFHWNIVGANLFFLALETVVYFALAVLTEYSLTFPSLLAWLHRVDDSGFDSSRINEDEDVATERERVKQGHADNDVVRISEMRKVYPSAVGNKVAVQCLSFGIPKGECFGFLGINGAGKTTTLSILSGEFPPTAGTAYIDGYNIQVDQSKIRRKIGYCPQFDALLELLTVREHLELYGRIKGLEGADLERVVRGKLEQMDLTDFENKAAGSLSGGNKRKLSVAIAMIGEPSIVFLDEVCLSSISSLSHTHTQFSSPQPEWIQWPDVLCGKLLAASPLKMPCAPLSSPLTQWSVPLLHLFFFFFDMWTVGRSRGSLYSHWYHGQWFSPMPRLRPTLEAALW
jgi:ATP-binding cassette, subfamily A (ABC1), member 3